MVGQIFPPFVAQNFYRTTVCLLSKLKENLLRVIENQGVILELLTNGLPGFSADKKKTLLAFLNVV